MSFSHTLVHVLPEDIQMFLFMENNRLGSFYQPSEHNNPDQSVGYTPMPYLYWLRHDTKTYSPHPDAKYPDICCSLPSVVFIVDELKSAVLCIVLTHWNVSVHCSTHCREQNRTVLDACMGKPSGTFMVLVNNITHNSAFRWKVRIMLHLESSGPQASQLPWPTFLAITDVLAK